MIITINIKTITIIIIPRWGSRASDSHVMTPKPRVRKVVQVQCEPKSSRLLSPHGLTDALLALHTHLATLVVKPLTGPEKTADGT